MSTEHGTTPIPRHTEPFASSVERNELALCANHANQYRKPWLRAARVVRELVDDVLEHLERLIKDGVPRSRLRASGGTMFASGRIALTNGIACLAGSSAAPLNSVGSSWSTDGSRRTVGSSAVAVGPSTFANAAVSASVRLRARERRRQLL